MSMVTSCPACTTTFRVTPEQLKHRAGKVRCGKCSGVFDAFKTLASLPDDVTGAEASSVRPAADRNAEQVKESASGTGDTATMQLQGALDISPPQTESRPALPQSTESAPRTRRTAWIAAIVVLSIALALQLAYAFRDQIAAIWPAARPGLERMCARLGCVVAFPQRTEQLAIESSDLQADPKRENTLVLIASLRNRGSGAVAHPSLELTLTNAQDQAVARRVFAPADYLGKSSAANRGMAGMSEVNIRIVLDTGDLKPAGYRLFLFYP